MLCYILSNFGPLFLSVCLSDLNSLYILYRLTYSNQIWSDQIQIDHREGIFKGRLFDRTRREEESDWTGPQGQHQLTANTVNNGF